MTENTSRQDTAAVGQAPKLRDGIMKRGKTWSYVIRVKNPETGVSRPRWVGGFDSAADAKAARD
jgi:integrase